MKEGEREERGTPRSPLASRCLHPNNHFQCKTLALLWSRWLLLLYIGVPPTGVCHYHNMYHLVLTLRCPFIFSRVLSLLLSLLIVDLHPQCHNHMVLTLLESWCLLRLLSSSSLLLLLDPLCPLL